MNKSKFAAVAGVVSLIAALAGCGGFVYTTVGGTVTGLTSTDTAVTNTLILRNDANYTATLSADGPFSFNVASDAAYTISVSTQPLRVYCTVANGTGKMTSSASITNVRVTCIPSAPVGGNVTGLNIGATLVLANNNGNTDTSLIDSLNVSSVTSSPTFTFNKYVPPGKPFAVSVYTQPAAQNCTVSANGTGVIDGADLNAYKNIMVTCAPAVPVSVALSGLAAGATLALTNNGDTAVNNVITTTINGNFTFNQSMTEGQVYNVAVSSQPAGQVCTVTNGSGTAHLADPTAATNIVVTCANK